MKYGFLVLLGLIILVSWSCDKTVEEVDPEVPVFYNVNDFVMGVDLSYVNAVQDYGGTYKDENGETDPFIILKNKGANLVRVRLWNNPQWQTPLYGSPYYSNLQDVEKTIARAKKAGMAVNLDFHYSDNWADPGKQETPAAWKNLNANDLRDSVYQYTLDVLNQLHKKNLTPEFVQIGNETNGGMLFPLGKVNNNEWGNFTALLNAGLAAVQDFETASGKEVQTILHVAQLQNADWWANGVINLGKVAPFDILGLSHYFVWSEVHDMNEIKNIIASLISKYKRKVMVVETAYPWTFENADSYTNIIPGTKGETGYGVSRDAQIEYMEDLTSAIYKAGGSGIMYWEPAWISSTLRDQWGKGSSWENNAFFDFGGNVLPVVKFMTKDYSK
ncbi:MAG: glycosyl hydrolase 53 family protein [Saprospiraceae bacterium]|nr:glycosyl hydrolase 53 family protein [Saprospiraceae bacterium]